VSKFRFVRVAQKGNKLLEWSMSNPPSMSRTTTMMVNSLTFLKGKRGLDRVKDSDAAFINFGGV
jgi:hypothetical protein